MTFNARDVYIPVPTTGGTFAVSLLKGSSTYVIRMYQLIQEPEGASPYWRRVADLKRAGRGFRSWEEAKQAYSQQIKEIAQLHNFWCFKGAINKMTVEKSVTNFFNGSIRIDV